MPTVGELSSPFENYLLPVLASGVAVCTFCHSTVQGGYTRCYQCAQAVSILPHTADAVSFVGLALKGGQFARDLWVYKRRGDEDVHSVPTWDWPQSCGVGCRNTSSVWQREPVSMRFRWSQPFLAKGDLATTRWNHSLAKQ